MTVMNAITTITLTSSRARACIVSRSPKSLHGTTE